MRMMSYWLPLGSPDKQLLMCPQSPSAPEILPVQWFILLLNLPTSPVSSVKDPLKAPPLPFPLTHLKAVLNHVCGLTAGGADLLEDLKGEEAGVSAMSIIQQICWRT